jgi:hypothetical protein
LLAQKQTLKEVSQYRKRGRLVHHDQESNNLQVTGDHLSLKNKPKRKSPNGGTKSKTKAMAHLRKQLNTPADMLKLK